MVPARSERGGTAELRERVSPAPKLLAANGLTAVDLAQFSVRVSVDVCWKVPDVAVTVTVDVTG
jgi:hypothetical protein